MKSLTILTLCLFLMGISVVALADEPAQVDQPEQSITTEAAEEGQLTQEAKELPSTLMIGEEKRSSVMQEVEELKGRYIYEEELHDD
jgi:hypothetical protein